MFWFDDFNQLNLNETYEKFKKKNYKTLLATNYSSVIVFILFILILLFHI